MTLKLRSLSILALCCLMAVLGGCMRTGGVLEAGVIEGRVPAGDLRRGQRDRDLARLDPAPATRELAYAGNSSGSNYLDTPNLAGYDGSMARRSEQQQPAPLMAAAAPASALPMIDEVPPPAGHEAPPAAHAGPVGGQTYIPPEGVDMDAAFGLGDAPQAAPPSAAPSSGRMTIAEGDSAQPVVDGIGMDEPLLLVKPNQQ